MLSPIILVILISCNFIMAFTNSLAAKPHNYVIVENTFPADKINDPLAMYMEDVCTVPVNLAGIPALSMNCGFADGMPIGMQLIGPNLSEERLLQAAYTFEQARPDTQKVAALGEVK